MELNQHLRLWSEMEADPLKAAGITGSVSPGYGVASRCRARTGLELSISRQYTLDGQYYVGIQLGERILHHCITWVGV
jgi:hypothetical protein